jgi:hypothetical protein
MDKIIKAASKARRDGWQAFKSGISLKGYDYYKPPEAVKYRYPAPGSCALDVDDHFNLYKDDWKRPFRQSEFNIRPIEQRFDDDDPRQATSYISGVPQLDPHHPREGSYD